MRANAVKHSGWLLIALLLLLARVPGATAADSITNDVAEFTRRAQKTFDAAKTRMDANTTNQEAIWQFARACFDLADLATTDGRREELANQGISASRRLVGINPKSAEAHYYLGMNLGELAETKTLGALKIVPEMETEFKTELELNSALDHAGADRNLGLLYRDCPGWPASIGNRSKARQHLQAALTLAPDFPENLMNLIEGELKWGDQAGAVRDLKSLDSLWPKARKQYTGEEWEVSWADWQKRREIVQKKANEASKVIEPPRKP